MSRWTLGIAGCLTVVCSLCVFVAVAGTALIAQSDLVERDFEARRSSGSTPVATTEVDMRNDRFQPSSIAVQAGDTITWTNSDSQRHNVIFRSGGPQSGLIEKGETFQWTPDTAGVFDYVCTLHGGMVGKVTVAASEPDPAAQ